MGIQLQLSGQQKDLGGGFTVRRLLPSAQKQSIGPFVFFDHFGPITVNPGDNHDVRPHPHIGLATVTYLFEGAIMHRDSIGSAQCIEPGAINWMTAGRGIVHSERGPEDLKRCVYVNHGIQLWAALPLSHEETDPAFEHTPAANIPELAVGGAKVRVLIGAAFGKTSPVKTYTQTVYLDVHVQAGGVFELPPLAAELAFYSVDKAVAVNGQLVPAQTLTLLVPGAPVTIGAATGARLVVVGGSPLESHRLIWWNFVSSRQARIDEAADDWQAQRMGRVAGDAAFIPLPKRRPA